MVDSISTRGIQLAVTRTLAGGQRQLTRLTQQLATGRYSDNMSDYSPSNAQNLLNFNNQINLQRGYLDVIGAIAPRMEVYELAMTGIESTVSSTMSTLVNYPIYNEAQNDALRAELRNALSQIEYYLNQRIGERFVFAGARFSTAPVADLNGLPILTISDTPTIVSPDEVPAYDVDFDPLNPGLLVPEANTNESVNIDATRSLTYGFNSNEEAFQQIIMGLRLALAATYDPANYSDLMATAKDYLRDGLANTRGLHAENASNMATMARTQDMIQRKVANLQTQVDNIEKVDIYEIGIKIVVLQAQLEASYSAVSSLINLTILDYLR
ncbi:MAG: hypothetical protein FWF24_00370 [Alphaproteobacteria bacterium]|nr:hypothetical protein [Alphaproteobacteria bacterium]